jgi:hypothetical protein
VHETPATIVARQNNAGFAKPRASISCCTLLAPVGTSRSFVVPTPSPPAIVPLTLTS